MLSFTACPIPGLSPDETVARWASGYGGKIAVPLSTALSLARCGVSEAAFARHIVVIEAKEAGNG